jgi:hypothetical protein
MSIPAALLERLTPEQRARVEERMKAKSSDPPKMTRQEYCLTLTRKQLENGVTFGQDRKSCTRSIFASTSNKLEMRIECGSQNQKNEAVGTLQLETTDPEKLQGSIRLTLDGGR